MQYYLIEDIRFDEKIELIKKGNFRVGKMRLDKYSVPTYFIFRATLDKKKSNNIGYVKHVIDALGESYTMFIKKDTIGGQPFQYLKFSISEPTFENIQNAINKNAI